MFMILSFFIYSSCERSNTKGLKNLLLFLEINENDSIVLGGDSIIDETNIPYDTINKEILLLKLNDYQKSLISNLYPLNTTNNFSAYLYEIQQRVPDIYTVIIYTESEYGILMYFVNFKDTTLIDYLFNEGNIGYVTEQKANKEIIEGYKRRIEFHNDTIYKIEIRTIKFDYYSDDKKDFEYKTDSIISTFKIGTNGRFNKIGFDSISFVQSRIPK